MHRTIKFELAQGDITKFQANVIAVKYAQGFHEEDQKVALALMQDGIAREKLEPKTGDYSYIGSAQALGTPNVLFVGVTTISQFYYEHIKNFSSFALNTIAKVVPKARHLAMTLQGIAIGLDEVECFLSQFRGLITALANKDVLSQLNRVTIIEFDQARVARLRKKFEEFLQKNPHIAFMKEGSVYELNFDTKDLKGFTNTPKRSALVATRMNPEMDQFFYECIQPTVHNLGLLCERMNEESLLTPFLQRTIQRIDVADLIIAELSHLEPNILLEIGYAWGKNRKIILLVKKPRQLPFEMHNQKLIIYETTKDAITALNNELLSIFEREHITQ